MNLAAQLGIVGTISGKEMRARCPLHSDNHPSFSMNINQGVWVCFGCNERGEFTRLVELVLSCSKNEAYQWVQSNGQLSSVEQLSRAFATAMDSPIGQYITDPDTKWERHYESIDNKIMPLWFLKRGFTWDTINSWGIKYDPMMDSVIVPVYWEDKLVGTVTRNTKENLPKYQNSPGLPRAEILFGKINPNAKRIYLVEGLLDCIWASQCGHTALSLLGTSISNRQILILRKYRFGQIVLALDNDEAGKKATQNLVMRLKDGGWLLPQLSIVKWPEGVKDANDCTPEQLREVFEETEIIGFA